VPTLWLRQNSGITTAAAHPHQWPPPATIHAGRLPLSHTTGFPARYRADHPAAAGSRTVSVS
jgi:hypothetical protein